MSLIDWSDPDEMLGLLVEYVGDEASTSHLDPDRYHFLRQLARELETLADDGSASADRVEETLREIVDSRPRDFAGDPVMEHLEACIDEIQRIRRGASAP